MATEVPIPTMGESVNEVVLLEWLKQDGEYVERDEPICLLETDKANVDLPAPASGILHPLKEADATLSVGDIIARIEEGAKPKETPAKKETASKPKEAPVEAKDTKPKEAPAEAQTAPEKTSAAKAPAATPDAEPSDHFSPAVRRLLSEHSLDPSAIPGTGRDGRLIKEDVLNYLKTRPKEQPAEPPAQQAPEPPSAPAPITPTPAAHTGGERRVPMTKIRQRIAEHLLAAQQNAAMLTTFNEADLSGIVALRTRYKERFTEVHGVSLGFMAFFSRAVILSLREFPEINASIEGTDIIYHDYVNLGIAVGTERGLVVPVMRQADRLSLAQIEGEIKRLAKAARDNKLKLDELSGGTFTITNGGVFGSLLSTPILNLPQSAILGMHAIKDRPIAVNGQVEIRPMMYLALSYDHRLIDGQQSVSFLVRLKEYLEDPARLMLEI